MPSEREKRKNRMLRNAFHSEPNIGYMFQILKHIKYALYKYPKE